MALTLTRDDIHAIASEVVNLLREDEPREEKPKQQLKPWDRAEYLRAMERGGKALGEFIRTHEMPTCETRIRRIR